MRGYRWTIGAGTNSCWMGTYEIEKQQAFAAAVRSAVKTRPDCAIFDIGANVGFYSLLSARLCADAGNGIVHSFEPFPANLQVLQRHIQLNNLSNVTIHDVAVSDVSGQLNFAAGDCAETGKLDQNGDVAVRTIQLDEEIQNSHLPVPAVIKIDVEGAEAQVLSGARALLSEYKPELLVAIHGSSVLREVQQILSECHYGFEVEADDEPGFFELTATALRTC